MKKISSHITKKVADKLASMFKADRKDFEEKWDNLATMRGQITKDLKALRATAREQDKNGIAPIELEFPEYSLFTDEALAPG